jgi:hypothetical protein
MMIVKTQMQHLHGMLLLPALRAGSYCHLTSHRPVYLSLKVDPVFLQIGHFVETVYTDEAEITSPLSLAEWFESYYAHTLSEYGPAAKDPVKRGKLVQGICHAGEVMYM